MNPDLFWGCCQLVDCKRLPINPENESRRKNTIVFLFFILLRDKKLFDIVYHRLHIEIAEKVLSLLQPQWLVCLLAYVIGVDVEKEEKEKTSNVDMAFSLLVVVVALATLQYCDIVVIVTALHFCHYFEISLLNGVQWTAATYFGVRSHISVPYSHSYFTEQPALSHEGPPVLLLAERTSALGWTHPMG